MSGVVGYLPRRTVAIPLRAAPLHRIRGFTVAALPQTLHVQIPFLSVTCEPPTLR